MTETDCRTASSVSAGITPTYWEVSFDVCCRWVSDVLFRASTRLFGSVAGVMSTDDREGVYGALRLRPFLSLA